MIVRQLGRVAANSKIALIGSTGYPSQIRANSLDISRKQLSTKVQKRDQSTSPIPDIEKTKKSFEKRGFGAGKRTGALERGPMTGPGPSDKSTEKEQIQTDIGQAQTTWKLGSQELSHYSKLSIDNILNNGFIVQGREILGTPIAVTPDTVLRWRVENVEDITCDSLALFYNCLPPIDLVIIGTGHRSKFVDPREIEKLLKKGIKVEVMSTRSAAGIYNLLRSDQNVGAALLPDIEIQEEAVDKWQNPISGGTIGKQQKDMAHAFRNESKLNVSKEFLRKDEESIMPIPDFIKYNKKDASDGLSEGTLEFEKPDLRKPSEKAGTGQAYRFGMHSSAKFGKRRTRNVGDDE